MDKMQYITMMLDSCWERFFFLKTNLLQIGVFVNVALVPLKNEPQYLEIQTGINY